VTVRERRLIEYLDSIGGGMTREDRERVDELVNELGEQIAKEVRSEVDFLVWLKEVRNNLTTQIQDMGGDG